MFLTAFGKIFTVVNGPRLKKIQPSGHTAAAAAATS